MITSMKFRQPSLGTKAVIFLPFLMSCTLTHFLMAELGCLASTPLQGKTTGKAISVAVINTKLTFLPRIQCEFYLHFNICGFL